MYQARTAFLLARSLLTVGLAASMVAAQETSGTIVGLVVDHESGAPLPYSVVAVPSLAIRRFSTDSGTFVLREVPQGSRIVHIRRLGYAPKEVTVSVRAGARDSIRVELTRIAVKLAPVHVRADPPCTTPGLRAVQDSSLATVLTQFLMNGEQYRLLSETYPFVYTHERLSSSKLKSGDLRVDAVDTLLVASKRKWRYRPGTILTRAGGRRGGGTFFNVPTLLELADPLFVDNHCFVGGGIDHVDGLDLIRIDVIAWSRIKNPDVNGSIFLDPHTFQIRRSVLRLSRPPKVAGLIGMEVTTVFQEALPSIPVVSEVYGVQTYDKPSRWRDYVAAYEHHQLIGFRFVGARPGEDPP